MKHGLYIFILLSALVHGAIISLHNQWIFSLSDNHEQGRSSLEVELAQRSQQQASSSTSAVIPDSPAKKTQTLPINSNSVIHTLAPTQHSTRPVTNRKKTASDISSPPASTLAMLNTRSDKSTENRQTANQQLSESSSKLENNHTEKIKSLLNRELAKYFYYPRAAQRRNRQGKVILDFTINSQGHIENIQVNKSSGYRILDSAAIDALKKIEASEILSQTLNGNSSQQTLPITYKLRNF